MGRWLLALGVLILGCDPELPGRSCATNDDCFTQEACVANTCLPGAREAETDADVSAIDASVESDFGAGDPEPGADGGSEAEAS